MLRGEEPADGKAAASWAPLQHARSPSTIPSQQGCSSCRRSCKSCMKRLCDWLVSRCLGWPVAQALLPVVSVDLNVLLVLDVRAFRLPLGCSLYPGSLGILIKWRFNAEQHNVNQHHLIYFHGIGCLASGRKREIATTFSCRYSFSVHISARR